MLQYLPPFLFLGTVLVQNEQNSSSGNKEYIYVYSVGLELTIVADVIGLA